MDEIVMYEKRKDVVLVVPSIRESSWNRFVEEWKKIGLFDLVDVILVEDNPKATFAADGGLGSGLVMHYDWEDIKTVLGENEWIVPRRSDTVRSFGYYMAWKHGSKYILTLDDDCYPPTQPKDGFEYQNGAKGFLETHIRALENRQRWFNTLTKAKPRGIPFFNNGQMKNVAINHGLWTNVLDYDAPTQLANPAKEEFTFDNRIVPVGQYFPMCGMNVMWKREYTVLMYHLLMGRGVKDFMPGVPSDELHTFPFDRFGDIWCGIFAKKIADVKGLAIATGLPYIHHDRASNPFSNLKKEANGIEVNERLWEWVDQASLFPAHSLENVYHQLGGHIANYKEFPQYAEYFATLGKAMQTWSKLFKEEGK